MVEELRKRTLERVTMEGTRHAPWMDAIMRAVPATWMKEGGWERIRIESTMPVIPNQNARKAGPLAPGQQGYGGTGDSGPMSQDSKTYFEQADGLMAKAEVKPLTGEPLTRGAMESLSQTDQILIEIRDSLRPPNGQQKAPPPDKQPWRPSPGAPAPL
jgi:hypothetical protein